MENDLEAIIVRGAKVHNLKNIDAIIPRDRFVVITGPSGSGKSSLAFDTIYAEGQRRYVESLSAYARQFLEQLEKPDVESISGLSPTISIEQKTTSYNPRSTVGTVTEIYDYLRLLYSRISQPFCWKCKKPISSQTPQQMVDQMLSYPEETKISVLAPLIRERKGEYQKQLQELRQKGFARVRVDGEVFDLSQDISLDKNKKHSIDLYLDRFIIRLKQAELRTTLQGRVAEAVDLALKMGKGLLILIIEEHQKRSELLISEKFACLNCQMSYPEAEPRTFSFNSPMGACAKCNGLGTLQEESPNKNKEKDDEFLSKETLNDESLKNLIQTQEIKICPTCNGSRLRNESLHFKINGSNIAELCQLSIEELLLFFKNLELNPRQLLIADRILKEIQERLHFLIKVGLTYLSLSRAAQSLSGGETQRIRLATQIGSALVGVIYVLDEPSIGLHQRDNEKLIQTLQHLRDLGNTVLVVEHDQDTMENADWILDLGPGAGNEGGKLIASGSLKDIANSKESMTGKYLRKELQIQVPKKRRPIQKNHSIRIYEAFQNNLKNINVQFPLSTFTCVTGISGSGKSSLVIDTLYPALAESVYHFKLKKTLKIKKIEGLELIDKVIDIDQSPIGRTPRSNPSTYTGLFTLIRDVFAQLPEAKIRGFSPGRFSFNVKGGRCEACQGDGVSQIEMHFLPDVYVKCETCQGKRYNRETLGIYYKGKNISEILKMPCSEALSFFEAIPTIQAKLKILNDVGLGYIQLGQSATTLSGGEAQRIKLAKELSKRSTGRTVYILDEPSTGLHFNDVNKLIQILQALVDQGNTVIVIEHNLDIIKVADHIIDIGPEGGAGGGEILASGTPEEISKNPKSITGKFLKKFL